MPERAEQDVFASSCQLLAIKQPGLCAASTHAQSPEEPSPYALRSQVSSTWPSSDALYFLSLSCPKFLRTHRSWDLYHRELILVVHGEHFLGDAEILTHSRT